ncbi:LppU/SCO3897 family protein [Amycolatopsis sp. H20-H5]|uniref:LppU/SCO3897 family protein n=1 Tax=Amycolatopsis sp. H20-H5 TaxID=3046309 RepID=UPI002DB8B327|nr:hypothetical protein [Amycolatopsis sp. H20-H5]MEC3976066.1 hypothetical protein [Amycolatopsis sp. H20-H5]
MTTPEDRPQQPVPAPAPEANPFQPTFQPTAQVDGAQPYPAAPPIATAPKNRGGLKVALRIGIPLLVLAVIAVIGLNSFSAEVSNVGDCLKGNTDNAESVTSVACGPEANYKIVGKFEDRSQIGLSLGGCDDFSTATVAFWEGVKSSRGTLLCLEDAKNPGKAMPALGDCVKGDISDATKVDKVPCGPNADFKVAAVEAGSPLGGLTTAVCTKTPSAAASMEWKRQGSLSSKVLCLEDVKDPSNRKPAVGECLVADAKEELHLGPCQKGASKVLGQVDGLTKMDSLSKTVEEICKDFPGADQAASWSMQGSLAVTTYCMRAVKQ